MGNGMTRDWKVEWQVELRQLNGKWSRVGQVLGGVVRVSETRLVLLAGIRLFSSLVFQCWSLTSFRCLGLPLKLGFG